MRSAADDRWASTGAAQVRTARTEGAGIDRPLERDPQGGRLGQRREVSSTVGRRHSYSNLDDVRVRLDAVAAAAGKPRQPQKGPQSGREELSPTPDPDGVP